MYEFVKNADSTVMVMWLSRTILVGLATSGVCVFGALTSVGALFLFKGIFGECVESIGLSLPA